MVKSIPATEASLSSWSAGRNRTVRRIAQPRSLRTEERDHRSREQGGASSRSPCKNSVSPRYGNFRRDSFRDRQVTVTAIVSRNGSSRNDTQSRSGPHSCSPVARTRCPSGMYKAKSSRRHRCPAARKRCFDEHRFGVPGDSLVPDRHASPLVTKYQALRRRALDNGSSRTAEIPTEPAPDGAPLGKTFQWGSIAGRVLMRMCAGPLSRHHARPGRQNFAVHHAILRIRRRPQIQTSRYLRGPRNFRR